MGIIIWFAIGFFLTWHLFAVACDSWRLDKHLFMFVILGGACGPLMIALWVYMLVKERQIKVGRK